MATGKESKWFTTDLEQFQEESAVKGGRCRLSAKVPFSSSVAANLFGWEREDRKVPNGQLVGNRIMVDFSKDVLEIGAVER